MHLTAQGTHTHTHHADTSNCGSWSWLNGNAVVSMWLKPKQWSSVWHNVNSWEAHEYGGVCKAKPRYQQKDFQWNTAQKHTWQYERRVRFNVISLHGARRAQQEHQELSMCLALENKLINGHVAKKTRTSPAALAPRKNRTSTCLAVKKTRTAKKQRLYGRWTNAKLLGVLYSHEPTFIRVCIALTFSSSPSSRLSVIGESEECIF